MSQPKLVPGTIVQWLWLDMGHTQIAQHIVEWGENPVINLSDKHFYTYFNLRYLSTKPFQQQQLSSITPLDEIIRWARAGRSGAGASGAVGYQDFAAYFHAVIAPIMLAQSGIPKALRENAHLDNDKIVVAPMANTDIHDELQQYITNMNGNQCKVQSTIYMAVINLSPALSRYWLHQDELLSKSKSILLDLLPGIERSQIYGPALERYHIKDCLTAAEFNLGAALLSHFTHDTTRQNRHLETILIPIMTVTPDLGNQIVPGQLRLSDAFMSIADYFPSCIIVWTSYNCHDIGGSQTNYITDIGVKMNKQKNNGNPLSDSEYELQKRDDKKTCNESMLRSNAVLARMLYNNMRTRGELRRDEIIRTPLFVTIEKARDKKTRGSYRKHCGSASYHYVTNTDKYRASLVSSQPKAQAAESAMVDQLSEQLAASRLNVVE